MEIRQFQMSDHSEWLRMRRALWPDIGPNETNDANSWLSQSDTATFVAARPGGGLAGFAEFATRDWAEGCERGPVAYLEGWYVDPDIRHCGIGASLIRAGEAWAVCKGLQELASDCQIENTVSQVAHLAIGFAEVERIVVYRKLLNEQTTRQA